MYEYMFDTDPLREPGQAVDYVVDVDYMVDDEDGFPEELFMSAYQKRRQGVYDRAKSMCRDTGRYAHGDTEIAKAEAGLVRHQAWVSRGRGAQLYWLKSLLRRGGPARLGYRSPVDMVSALLDVHRETARGLLYLAERVDDGTVEDVRAGRVSYVRVLEEAHLREAGASFEDVRRSRRWDLRRVKRFLAGLRKISRTREREQFESQYVNFQPSLDESHYQVSGRLGSYEGEICRRALEQRAERVIPPPAVDDGRPRHDPGLRRALALTTLCQDELDQPRLPAQADETEAAPDDTDIDTETGRPVQAVLVDNVEVSDPEAESAVLGGEAGESPTTDAAPVPGRNRREPLLMVVADKRLAEESGFEKGVAVLVGPRVGPDIVDLVECQGRVENVTITETDIISRRAARAVRPGLRRAVLARDDGCVIDGCRSGYRLEVHHIVERSRGGANTPGNLASLCWYHHHVAVHRRGLRLDPRSPPHRRRLIRPRPTGRRRLLIY